MFHLFLCTREHELFLRTRTPDGCLLRSDDYLSISIGLKDNTEQRKVAAGRAMSYALAKPRKEFAAILYLRLTVDNPLNMTAMSLFSTAHNHFCGRISALDEHPPLWGAVLLVDTSGFLLKIGVPITEGMELQQKGDNRCESTALRLN